MAKKRAQQAAGDIPEHGTWAMFRAGESSEARLVALIDRDAAAADGSATVIITGTPADSVREVTVDIELLYAKPGATERKVVRTLRKTISLDATTHSFDLPIQAKGSALNSYAVLVRAEGADDLGPDAVDSMVKVANQTSHTAMLALGRR